MRALLVSATLALAVAAGCSGDDGNATDSGPGTSRNSDEQVLADARERWADAAITDYDWSFDVSCFCPAWGFDVEVRDGAAGAVEVRPSTRGGLPPQDDVSDKEPPFTTVEEFLDHVEGRLGDDLDDVRAEYDEATGRPVKLSLDPDSETYDDETYLTVTAFEER
jgi:hypothetical protein